ncbi:ERCC4 domain-containing protein [Georgenia ruanii]|nr:histone-like nucleoid-structuring protein Lsr2 [Georgenia ruanii]
MIFWQSPRTAKQARPAVTLPRRRAAGQVLDIVVDSREKYPYRFSHQQASTTRRSLPAGDYAVELDGEVVAAVERKSLADLAGALTTGRLTYALAELAALPRAAVVVEDRYSAIFKLEHVAGGVVADALAEAQARFPAVPIVFAETRPLAQEWTYRFLGAGLRELALRAGEADALRPHEAADGEDGAAGRAGAPAAGPAARARPADVEGTSARREDVNPAAVRAWARANGVVVADRGRIAAAVVRAYLECPRQDSNLQPTD